MREWFNLHAWKACVLLKEYREFESHPLRQFLNRTFVYKFSLSAVKSLILFKQNDDKPIMEDFRHTYLCTTFIILTLSLCYKQSLQAQYRQAPARLHLQLQRVEDRIAEKNTHIEEAAGKLDASRVVQKARQLASCRRRHRIMYVVRCRHLTRELSNMQQEQRYWRGIFNKYRREKNALTARRDRINQQIADEKRKAVCIAQTRNRRNIYDFLKSEDIKIVQEIDYDSVENGTCNSENNYFESQIDASHNEEDFDLSIDQRCTYRALKRYNSCGRRKCFLKCKGPNPKNTDPEFVREGPCISRGLHHYTHQSLTEVSSCLQLDPKILFSLFVNESGFNPLKKSYTSATGMGQITGIFIEDININFFDTYKNEILPALSKNPLAKKACRSVINKMNNLGKIQKRPLCQRISLDMNILYSAIAYIRATDAITKKLLAHQNRSNIRIPENSPFRHALAADITPRTRNLFKTLAIYQTLSPNERRIITELALYSHNLPKTVTLFQTYLNDPRENNKLGDDFTGQRGRWRQYLERNRAFISRSENRQNEILGYIYPRRQSQGGLKVLEQNDERAFMRGRMTEIEREGRNRERIYCRPY